jgi:Phage tail tube protein, GTA-gp10
MANIHRGEISANFDGEPHTLCLTLGALAELENAFGVGDMLALAERFSTGRLSAGDAIRILGIALRAGGHAINDTEVAELTAPGGAGGFVDAVARLLAVTFAAPPPAGAPVGNG